MTRPQINAFTKDGMGPLELVETVYNVDDGLVKYDGDVAGTVGGVDGGVGLESAVDAQAVVDSDPQRWLLGVRPGHYCTVSPRSLGVSPSQQQPRPAATRLVIKIIYKSPWRHSPCPHLPSVPPPPDHLLLIMQISRCRTHSCSLSA